jgi:hypothetical protein
LARTLIVQKYLKIESKNIKYFNIGAIKVSAKMLNKYFMKCRKMFSQQKWMEECI